MTSTIITMGPLGPPTTSLATLHNQDRPSAWTGGKGSGAVGVLFIGVFEGKEIVHQEIAIRDFPIRFEPFITRMRVRGSRGIGVRHFGFPAYKGITTGEVVKY
jgi:hypothetical protein